MIVGMVLELQGAQLRDQLFIEVIVVPIYLDP
jgi:hypothetical protein